MTHIERVGKVGNEENVDHLVKPDNKRVDYQYPLFFLLRFLRDKSNEILSGKQLGEKKKNPVIQRKKLVIKFQADSHTKQIR